MNKTAMQKSDLVERAGVMLDQADKIGCKQFVTPKVNNNSKGTSDRVTSLRYPLLQDVKNGHEKLNLAFVANLFNTHPHLDPPAEDLDIIEETREEKVRFKAGPEIEIGGANIFIFTFNHSDIPQLDELSRSEPEGELPLLRSQQRAHPVPGFAV